MWDHSLGRYSGLLKMCGGSLATAPLGAFLRPYAALIPEAGSLSPQTLQPSCIDLLENLNQGRYMTLALHLKPSCIALTYICILYICVDQNTYSIYVDTDIQRHIQICICVHISIEVYVRTCKSVYIYIFMLPRRRAFLYCKYQ